MARMPSSFGVRHSSRSGLPAPAHTGSRQISTTSSSLVASPKCSSASGSSRTTTTSGHPRLATRIGQALSICTRRHRHGPGTTPVAQVSFPTPVRSPRRARKGSPQFRSRSRMVCRRFLVASSGMGPRKPREPKRAPAALAVLRRPSSSCRKSFLNGKSNGRGVRPLGNGAHPQDLAKPRVQSFCPDLRGSRDLMLLSLIHI